MFTNYDGVLKVDGEVGNKKAYDPRSYLKLAETGMATRVQRACEDLRSAGTSPTPDAPIAQLSAVPRRRKLCDRPR